MSGKDWLTEVAIHCDHEAPTVEVSRHESWSTLTIVCQDELLEITLFMDDSAIDNFCVAMLEALKTLRG